MNQISSALKPVFGPIQTLYNKAFNANKYAAGIGLSVVITTALFFVMVVLISLGDSGMKEDTSIKLADVVMPERQIDTFLSEVEKPDKPEEQPEDIAQPELDLQPLTGIDVSIAKPKATFKAGGSFFRDGEYIPLFKVQPIYPRRAQERGTEGFAIVSFTITEPVPDVCKVISPFEGADNVDPTALRSPKLEEEPPPTSVPPGVTPSPILKLPVSTSTAR